MRKRILEDADAGLSAEDVAVKYRVGRRTVNMLVLLRQKTGSLEPIRGRQGRKSTLEPRKQETLQTIGQNSDLHSRRGGSSCRYRFRCRRCGWLCGSGASGLKEFVHAAEQHRPDVSAKRRWWMLLTWEFFKKRLVFLDETGIDTKMVRRYGWGDKSARVISYVPHGHWKTTTFIAALRWTGLTALLVLDGAMNGEAFLAYIQQFLIPTLQRGDLVIMDNLLSHKQTGVLAALEASG